MRPAGTGSTLEQSLPRNPSGHWPPDLTIRSRGSNATSQGPRAEAGPADRSAGRPSLANSFNLNTPESAETRRKDLTDFHQQRLLSKSFSKKQAESLTQPMSTWRPISLEKGQATHSGIPGLPMWLNW